MLGFFFFFLEVAVWDCPSVMHHLSANMFFLLFCFRGGGVEGLWVLRLVCLLACFIVLVWINFFQIKWGKPSCSRGISCGAAQLTYWFFPTQAAFAVFLASRYKTESPALFICDTLTIYKLLIFVIVALIFFFLWINDPCKGSSTSELSLERGRGREMDAFLGSRKTLY